MLKFLNHAALTSLAWTLALLYGFCSGTVSRPAPAHDDYAALYETVKPVKISKR